ncbi:MAG: right-handed parallel beta-helix repeat-containing protein [Bacteroidetes bacterium]|nr:right-handed parallel beta-helix repeat-containing protein [Bacteroidota bacterium]
MKRKVLLQLVGIFFFSNIFATIHYVSNTGSNMAPYASWATAGTDLQTVINACTAGDSVFVKAGTYYPNSYPPYTGTPILTNRDYTFFVKDGVKIFGGFNGSETSFSARNVTANVTILSGDIGVAGTATDNCLHVVMASAPSSGGIGVTIDGFTITNGHNESAFANGGGNLTVNTNAIARAHGVGITLTNGTNTIVNNIIFNNATTHSGMGAGLYIDGGSNTIQNNKINANSTNAYGGGIYTINGTHNISYNEIYNDSALSSGYGGGMYLGNGTYNVSYNSIHDNKSNSTAVAGGGIYMNNATNTTNTFTYNKIYNNSAGGGGGGASLAGSYNPPTTVTTINVSNNFFYNNFTTGNSGGGLMIGTGVINVYNNVFYDNNASSTLNGYGGAIYINQTSKSTTANNTFYNNKAKFTGGGIFVTCGTGNNHYFNNNIFWGNTSNGSSTIGGADFAGSGSPVYAKNNMLQLATGNYSFIIPASNNTGAIYATDPLFVNTASPIGPDGLTNTVDDGLYVKCTSPAIAAGATGAGIPLDDNVGFTRNTITPTIGAYEQIGAEALTLASAYTTLTKTQAGAVIYGDCATNLICTVTSTGGASAISGSTTAKVWIEGSQPPSWVKRHYEITPASSASTATGRVTLYFTQAEFDAFNAVNSIKLPTGPSDAAGKANLLVEKRGGISSDGTGLPGTYSSSPVLINPADADIVWSTNASRWQVTIDVSGFSGFWVKTSLIPIPLKWISFKGEINNVQQTQLNWIVAENDVADYEVEKSIDGANFTKIGTVVGRGDGFNNYSFTDRLFTQKAYYRIKQIDISGAFSYSTILLIQNKPGNKIVLYPNPVADNLFITGADPGTSVQLYNASGEKISTLLCNSNKEIISFANLPMGLYFIQVGNTGTYKVIKN